MITSFQGEHRWLSNFHPCTVTWDGPYPSVEHAYQAAKSLVKAERDRVRACPTPADAKRAGRTLTIRPDWDAVKLRVMAHLLRQKFAPGSALAARLLATGDAELVEGNGWGDTYWGVCDGVGQNHLGLMLMQIRDELRTPQEIHP